MKKRYLVLEDGTVFEGFAFGADAKTVGELVFTTGMCGYIETLTDPSYYGQIVLQTFPMIGNYGIISADYEGTCCVKGYVVREWCDTPSNFRCEKTLDAFLKENRVPAICGVDTREITRIIREHGVMNAVICDEYPEKLTPIGGLRVKDADCTFFEEKTGKRIPIRDYRICNAVSAVTCKEPYTVSRNEGRYRVALMDYGAKKNIAAELVRRGCEVIVLPADTDAEAVMKLSPDGVMLSNGPGDPSENTAQIETLKKLLGRVPMFGICLGHQLLALADGAKTVKLKYGHRGVNQPVREANGNRTFITSQNHGYAVVSDSLKNGVLSFVNANDGTCEGIFYPHMGAFSVQFHPEACSGPKDTSFLFDEFIRLMEEKQNAAR